MNINTLYMCNIYIKTWEDVYGKYAESEFVKRAIVYHKKGAYSDLYIDLFSNEAYYHFNKNDAGVGELYISGGLVPISNTIKSFAERETDNLPKRKIKKVSKEIMNAINEKEKKENLE